MTHYPIPFAFPGNEHALLLQTLSLLPMDHLPISSMDCYLVEQRVAAGENAAKVVRNHCYDYPEIMRHELVEKLDRRFHPAWVAARRESRAKAEALGREMDEAIVREYRRLE